MKKVKEIKAKPNPITCNDLFALATTTYVLRNERKESGEEREPRHEGKERSRENENYVARCVRLRRNGPATVIPLLIEIEWNERDYGETCQSEVFFFN